MIHPIHPAIARAQAAEIALANHRREHPAPPRDTHGTPSAPRRTTLRRLAVAALLRRPAAQTG
jgi:hypothetical protein